MAKRSGDNYGNMGVPPAALGTGIPPKPALPQEQPMPKPIVSPSGSNPVQRKIGIKHKSDGSC